MIKFNKRVFWAYFITAWTIRLILETISPSNYGFISFLISADIHLAVGLLSGITLK